MHKKTTTNTNGQNRNEKENDEEKEATDSIVVDIERKLLKQSDRTTDQHWLDQSI